LADRADSLVSDAGADVGAVEWCWLSGHRAVAISVKRDVKRYRELLIRELGPDRVIVKAALYSERELKCPLRADRRGHGRSRSAWDRARSVRPKRERVEVQYYASERKHAQGVWIDRYGSAVSTAWLGPSSLAEQPQPFGSSITEGTHLNVFYPLPHRGERPGSCTVQELPDSVVLSLTILTPQGVKTAASNHRTRRSNSRPARRPDRDRRCR
jgi:hypothetical protein